MKLLFQELLKNRGKMHLLQLRTIVSHYSKFQVNKWELVPLPLKARRELIQLLRKMQEESTMLSSNRQLPSLLMNKKKLKTMPREERQSLKTSPGEPNKISLSKSYTDNQPNKDRTCHSQLMKMSSQRYLDKTTNRECNNNKHGDRTKMFPQITWRLMHPAKIALSRSLTEVT